MKKELRQSVAQLIELSEEEVLTETKIKEITLEKESKEEIQEGIKLLKQKIDKGKYFNYSQEKADKTTKSYIEDEIKQIKRRIILIKEDFKDIKNDKDKIDRVLQNAKSNSAVYIELLKNLTNKLVEQDVEKDYYEGIIRNTELKHDYWNKIINTQNNKMEKLLNKELLLNTQKEDLEYQLNLNLDKLSKVEVILSNEMNYYNHDERKIDEDRLREKEKDLKESTKKIKKYLSSAPFIGHELLIAIEEDNKKYAKLMLKDLLRASSINPYANVKDYQILENESRRLIQEKTRLQTKIKDNDYLNDNFYKHKNRLSDLEELQKVNLKNIDEINKIVKRIDFEETSKLNDKINNLNISEVMLADYSEDLNHLIEYSVILNNTSLKYLKSYDIRLENKIHEINEIIKLRTGLINEEDKIKDIEKIKLVTQAITYLKCRIQIGKTADELYKGVDIFIDSITDKNDNFSEYIKVVKVIQLVPEKPKKEPTLREVLESKNEIQMPDFTIDNVIDLTGVNNED